MPTPRSTKSKRRSRPHKVTEPDVWRLLAASPPKPGGRSRADIDAQIADERGSWSRTDALHIPTLTTERLILRAPLANDFLPYAQFLASPRSKYMGGPYPLRAAWGIFCHDVAGWALFGHGALMIDLRASGKCVGQVGINHGPLFPEKELGWLVYEGYEGQGYATEAAALLRDWAARTLGFDRLVSYIHPQNARSIAVAERLGAVLDRLAAKQDPDDLVYRHLSPQHG